GCLKSCGGIEISNQKSEISNSAILPRMAAKPRIAMVGPGSLGSALAVSLSNAGYRVSEVVSREGRASRQRARRLANRVGARATTTNRPALTAQIVWLCVPDREIARCARSLGEASGWKGKVALHSSGALSSDELSVLRRKGAAVASLHPMMTFVQGVTPSLEGVPFALEGDALAGRTALSADPSFAEIPKPCANISRFWDEFGEPKRCIWRWHVRRCAIFRRAIAGFLKKCWVFEELSSPAERAAGEWHREILWVDETNRPCRVSAS